MDYNKDEHSQSQPDIQPVQPNVTPDSPAAYGIRRFDSDGNATSSFSGGNGGVNPTLGIWESYKLFWKNYTNFDGRSRRSEYWWPTLINSVIAIIFYCIMMGGSDFSLMDMAEMDPEELVGQMAGSAGYWLGMSLNSIFGLAILVPCISCAVRRLHDLNIDGWWYALMLLNCCGIVSLVFIVLFCMDSKPGTNEWGVSPKYKV